MPEFEQADAVEAMEPEFAASEGTTADAPPHTFVADEVLLAAVDLARDALLEVTPAETVGSVVGHLAEDEHVLTLLFAADLAGYPGWHWSVTLARVEDGEPTVLETELMPGESALLAPEWVPWSERLADYRAAQQAAAAAADAVATGSDDDGAGPVEGDEGDELDEEGFADEDLDDEDEDLADEDDEDEDDFDDDAELAGAFGRDDGDDKFDGIDIDALDESVDDESADDDAAAGDTDDDAAQPDESAP